MRITSRIKKLNAQLLGNLITHDVYKREVATILCPLDWQKRIQFENMTLA